MNSFLTDTTDNQLFNHNFMFPDKTLNFPAGWQKSRGHETSVIRWKKDDKDSFSIVIKNYHDVFTSICQEAKNGVPVYEKQVWEIGAILGVHKDMCATIKVHFRSRLSPRVLSISLDFMAEPSDDYYYGSITVPTGADYATVELGTHSAGTLLIKDVLFKRIFPADRYDVDSQGRLNINNVASVTRVLEPLEFVRSSRDFVEDVKATVTQKYSTIQDVLHLSTFSYSVINLGCGNIVYGMQLSPNGTNWAEDPVADDHIAPGQMAILCYNRFARYVRLRFNSENSITKLRIYFQGQG